MFQTIVWATDGSSDADSGLELVTELARVNGSSVVALHLDASSRVDHGSDTTARVDEEDVRETLEFQVEVLRAAGFDARLELVRSFGRNPSESVADEAAKLGADLIVIGAHGFGDLQAIFRGGIATGLTHHATCPVLVAPPKSGVTLPEADSAYAFPWSFR